MIHRLTQKIKQGTKFFIDHGKDSNSHNGRKEVGTVLASMVKEINGKLSSVIIGHFPNVESVKEMDAVSMEAGISVSEDDTSLVDDVNEVTGIALANSDINSPAFPGALRLSSIQCFENTDENKTLEKENTMGDHVITFQDVETFVKEHNVWPHQLYTLDNLKGDREFNKIIDENARLVADTKKLTTELDESKASVAKLEKDGKSIIAADRLKELFPKDLTDKQKQFITSRFKPDTLEDFSDETINKFIEEGRNDFAETAKLFGVANTKQSGTKEKSDESDSTSGEGDSTPEDEALKLIGVE